VIGLCAAVLALGSRSLRVSYRTPLTGCAREAGTGGALGLCRSVERIGIPVLLLDVPIWEAHRKLASPTGNCIITMGNGPWPTVRDEQTDENWLTLKNWLARGNALVIVTSAPGSLPKPLVDTVGFTHPTGFSAVSQRTSSFELRPSESEGRNSKVEDRLRTDERQLTTSDHAVEDRPETTKASTQTPAALTVELKGPRWRVTQGRSSKLEARNFDLRTSNFGPTELAADERGGVLFRFLVEKGAIYVLLDEFAWTNAGLDQPDNAQVFADILADAGCLGSGTPGTLAFDEYRHGHAQAGSLFTYAAGLPGFSTFVSLAAGWGLLYFWGRNIRLRPAGAYLVLERRSVREYIEAVARLYERARAAPLVVEAVALRLRHLAGSAADTPKAVEDCLRQAEEIAAVGCTHPTRPARPSAEMRVVTDLIRLRREYYGSRTIS